MIINELKEMFLLRLAITPLLQKLTGKGSRASSLSKSKFFKLNLGLGPNLGLSSSSTRLVIFNSPASFPCLSSINRKYICLYIQSRYRLEQNLDLTAITGHGGMIVPWTVIDFNNVCQLITVV